MNIFRSTNQRLLALIAILATTSALLAQFGQPEKPKGKTQEALARTSETAQMATQEDVLILQLERAHEAASSGDIRAAETLFHEIRSSAFPWHSWAATSGLIATYRISKDFSAAFRATAHISAGKPHLHGLMSVWDGDTAVLAGSLRAAHAYYSQALQNTSPGVEAVALNQLARLAILEDLPHEAAELKRQLMRRSLGNIAPEILLAEAMILDAVASGQLPTSPLSTLLHRSECTEQAPCLIQDGRRETWTGTGIQLAGISGFRFLPTPSDLGLLKANRAGAKRPRAQWNDSLSSACTPSTASDGFRHPMNVQNTVHELMAVTAQSNHPGLDIEGASTCHGDCEATFVAVARGCVRDVNPSKWGSATIEHYYLPDTWISQYGQASEIYYSAGAAISKGAILGKVGAAGTDSDRLHHELREADHPYGTYADYFSSLDRQNDGDWYQDPIPFYDSHRSYSFALWADEGAFTRYGSWSYVSGVGNRDDMRWALTTLSASKDNYARFSFTARDSGDHELWAFVPLDKASNGRAHYRLVQASDDVTLLDTELDQRHHHNVWARLGSILLTAGDHYYVEVASNTGEADQRIALDDILLTKP